MPQTDALADIVSRLAAIDAKTAAHREEGNRRGAEQAAHNLRFDTQLVELGHRVKSVEASVGTVASGGCPHPELKTGLEMGARIDRGICAALGLDYDALSAAPVDTLAKINFAKKDLTPVATVAKVARGQRVTWIGSALTIIILVLQFLLNRH